jgi:hypothetical protein
MSYAVLVIGAFYRFGRGFPRSGLPLSVHRPQAREAVAGSLANMRERVVDPLHVVGFWAAVIFGVIVVVLTPVLNYFALLAFLALPVVFLLWVVFVARDPGRTLPPPGALVAPVDGRVVSLDAAAVTIATSLLSVRTLRLPAGGRVERVAQRQDACEVVLATDAGEVVALHEAVRGGRISCALEPGAVCEAGRRFGMIPGGTRSEVRLPAAPAGGWTVAVGDRVEAGVSALAALDDQHPGGPA